MNCKNCNAPIPEGFRFCTNCGTPVEQPTVQQPVNEQPAQPVYAAPPVEPQQPEQPQQPAYQPPVQQQSYQQMPQQPVQQQGYYPPAQQNQFGAQGAGQYQSVMTAQPPKKSKGKTIGIIIGVVVVVLVIIIAIAGSSSDQKKIIGTWEGGIDFSDFYANSFFSEDDYEFLNQYADDPTYDMFFEYQFIFNDDGSCYVNITQDSYDIFMDSYVDLYRQTYINYSRQTYPEATESMSDDEVLEALSFSDVEKDLREDPDLQIDALNDFSDFATYTIEDGVITFYDADSYYYEADYEITGDFMTISFNEVENPEMYDYFQNIGLVKLDTVG